MLGLTSCPNQMLNAILKENTNWQQLLAFHACGGQSRKAWYRPGRWKQSTLLDAQPKPRLFRNQRKTTSIDGSSEKLQTCQTANPVSAILGISHVGLMQGQNSVFVEAIIIQTNICTTQAALATVGSGTAHHENIVRRVLVMSCCLKWYANVLVACLQCWVCIGSNRIRPKLPCMDGPSKLKRSIESMPFALPITHPFLLRQRPVSPFLQKSKANKH